jgi:hypothetical protein
MSRSIVLAWNHRVFRFHRMAVMAIWLAGVPAVSGITGEWIQDTNYPSQQTTTGATKTYSSPPFQYAFSDATADIATKLSQTSCSVRVDTSRGWGTSSMSTNSTKAQVVGGIRYSHRAPSHGQGAVQGSFRASAIIILELDSTCRASGASANVHGGGTAVAAMYTEPPAPGAPPVSCELTQSNVGCDAMEQQSNSVEVSGPGSGGAGGTVTTPGGGLYSSGPLIREYVYTVPETALYGGSVVLVWRVIATSSMSASAVSGWSRSSSAAGSITTTARVEAPSLVVTDGPPGV